MNILSILLNLNTWCHSTERQPSSRLVGGTGTAVGAAAQRATSWHNHPSNSPGPSQWGARGGAGTVGGAVPQRNVMPSGVVGWRSIRRKVPRWRAARRQSWRWSLGLWRRWRRREHMVVGDLRATVIMSGRRGPWRIWHGGWSAAKAGKPTRRRWPTTRPYPRISLSSSKNRESIVSCILSESARQGLKQLIPHPLFINIIIYVYIYRNWTVTSV
jgi:hypothetical protein